MVPAYDDPIIWEGHASMIEEIQRDLGQKPTAIFCSVGGAGLLGGILQGCKSVGWGDGESVFPKISWRLGCINAQIPSQCPS